MQQDKEKKTKFKIKPVPAALTAGAVLLAVLAAVLWVCAGKNGDESSVGIQVSQADVKETRADENEAQRVLSTVEIQLADYAVVVGSRFKVTAIVTPENTEQALLWNTSDPGVFTVDPDGTVTVLGTGTAVLTATVGTVTDAVVLEGIAAAADGSANNLPVYTAGGAVASNAFSPAGNNAGGQDGTSGGIVGAGGSTGPADGSGQTGAGPSGSDGSGGSSGNDGNAAGDDPTDPDNGSVDGENGADSSGLSGLLPEIGFTPVLSNVYVCREGETYYGEIITQPDVAIIYIKRRSPAFDEKIQSVLAALLPEEHSQVWNNYLSANTDRTFTAQERRVRIVVAANGGHSQIVIYN